MRPQCRNSSASACRSATSSPLNAATALKRPELGSLKPGCAGDATILSIKNGRFDYVDVVEEHLTDDRKIAAEGVVIAGRWWYPR